MLKSHQLGVATQVTKGELLSQGMQVLTMQCYCIVKLYCKSYWVDTVKDFIGYLFSLYYTAVLPRVEVGKAKCAIQSVECY